MNETAKSSDYKMIKYKDPATGKIKFRKVKHDDSIVQQESSETDESFRYRPDPFKSRASLAKSAKYKEAEAEYQKDKEFARKKAQQKNVKKEEVEGVDEANLRKMDHDEFMKHGDSNPKGRADPAWNAERKRRYRNAQAKNYRKMKKEKKDISVADYKKKTGKKTISLKHLTKNTHIDPFREGYIGGKGEKGRDYHNAGTFDKDTAYSHAKKHNGVVHKDPSGKYLVKHGRGKNVSEESSKEYGKSLDRIRDKEKKAKIKPSELDKLARLKNMMKNANEESVNLKTFTTFISELTAKDRAELAKRKAANQAKRGARRGPSKGTKSSEGDWTADQQKSAKALSFEIGKNDKHDAVHKTLAKAADASHPSLGGRKVKVKINGKSKEMAHKDLQHAVDLHKRLPLGKKAAVMNLIRDKGHEGVTAAANHFRKTYK